MKFVPFISLGHAIVGPARKGIFTLISKHYLICHYFQIQEFPKYPTVLFITLLSENSQNYLEFVQIGTRSRLQQIHQQLNLLFLLDLCQGENELDIQAYIIVKYLRYYLIQAYIIEINIQASTSIIEILHHRVKDRGLSRPTFYVIELDIQAHIIPYMELGSYYYLMVDWFMPFNYGVDILVQNLQLRWNNIRANTSNAQYGLKPL